MDDSLKSPDGRTTFQVQNDQTVVYQEGVAVGVLVVEKDGVIGPIPPLAPLPEPELPIPGSDMIQGQLRAVGDSHYEDDSGPILPLGKTYAGLWMARNMPDRFYSDADAMAEAGYQKWRMWQSLGWYDFWKDYEVPPVSFTAKEGYHVECWPDMDDIVFMVGKAMAERGIQLFWSCGDLQMFDGDLDACARWVKHNGQILRESGVRIAVADMNESWQNGITVPEDIDRYVIDPLREGYGQDFIALRSVASGDGETVENLNRWRRPGSPWQKHGHRGMFPNDHVTAVRHSRGINYPDPIPPDMRLGVESEPGGPDIDRPGHRGMGPINSPEALCLLAIANFMAPAIYVSHTHRGVKPWVGLLTDEPGFHEVPRVRAMLPPDLMSAYRQIVHGGRPDSPFTDADGFPEASNRRIDSVCTNDGRFVTLAYSGDGKTRLQALWALSFIIYTPHTGEAHSFTMAAGEVLDLQYDKGRLLVGQVT
jgi:hypothetical protein